MMKFGSSVAKKMRLIGMPAAAARITEVSASTGTLLPNFIISVIYSIAADDSLGTAALAFLLILVLSLGLWLLFRGKAPAAPTA